MNFRGNQTFVSALCPRIKRIPDGDRITSCLMRIRKGNDGRACAVMVAMLILAPKIGTAQTDEIQVYDAAIAEKGKFNLTWHNNFTPAGLTTPAFPGALVADKSLNGVPEWAYGVTDWFEAGLYMPLYSIGKRDPSSGASAMLDGFKIRLLFVAPHAD